MRVLKTCAAIAAGIAFGMYAPSIPEAFGNVSANAPSSVRIMSDGKSGSGVHIGNGFVITAAHVVDGGEYVTVRPNGAEAKSGAVLWLNEAYDVALVHVASSDGVDASRLDCRVPDVGEEISTIGNPLGMEFVTSYGRVAGGEREIGQLESVFVADLSIAPGNSGGPVYDADGDVVGIAVAIPLAPLGIGRTFTGFSAIVPASTICALLAR